MGAAGVVAILSIQEAALAMASPTSRERELMARLETAEAQIKHLRCCVAQAQLILALTEGGDGAGN